MMQLTDKQIEAQLLLAGDATYCMLFGGSRSGKTFLFVRNVVMRALLAPFSRHCILRFRFNHIKASIIKDTFPTVMRKAFPDVTYKMDKVDWYATLPNGSEIWFGGLDDKERSEKILGNEYVTIYLNECSQLTWQAVGMVMTRLAQKVYKVVNNQVTDLLKPRVYMDCNPPNKLHWTYLLFIKKIDPDTKLPKLKPQDYVSFKINPEDNKENQTDDYLETLKGLSARLRKRFLEGEFADAVANALFADETIDKWRVIDHAEAPNMVRIAIGVDPSGADDVDNADNDEIGIVAVGLGTDGRCYVLEDNTLKAGPAIWGKVVGQTYDRLEADVVTAEMNFGGAMVKQTIQIARPGSRTPFLAVTASRGKAVRAEPISALYEEGRVRHVGYFRELEDELAGFTTAGYVGAHSPNRADALVWAINALFPSMTKPKQNKLEAIPILNHWKR